ncbi:NAD(P)H-dependent glycerol-3-phosphate dehydrogenase [bacterium]
MKTQVGVLGAGSWGTALAVLLHSNGHAVSLWEFDQELAQILHKTRENKTFLPGVPVPPDIRVTSDLKEAAEKKEIVLIVVPSHVVREVCSEIAKLSLGNTILVSCSKGIENDSLLRMSEVILETVPGSSADRVVVFSGPSHAEEVGRGLPTVVTAASKGRNSCRRIQEIFMSPVFRVYSTDDVIGAELGAALKNVIAIAAGIIDGVGFGDNTKAALLTRGMVEITRLGIAMGANPLTFAGLSGMGDLIVTCTSRHSRNRHVGEAIGKGKTLKQVLEEMVMVAEGVRTTRSVYDLSQRLQVDMPISHEVYRVLFEDKDPKKAVHDLMTRNPKDEDWG